MKVSSTVEKKGFQPLAITMTFETEAELAAFEMRMSGQLYGVDVDCGVCSLTISPEYREQKIPYRVKYESDIFTTDYNMCGKVRKVVDKHWENK